MKAIICNQFGPLDGLSFEEIPIPSLKTDEVLIRTAYCGVNFPDTLIVKGKYQFKPDFPFSPGQEVSGEIAAVGRKDLPFKVGDRVLASMTFGGFREFAVAKIQNTYSLPEGVALSDAAAILESFATAFHGLKDRAMMTPGQTLVVLGASGGTGMAAVQLGKLFGCSVIAVCSTEEKRAFAKTLGADVTLPYENLKNNLKELGGVDVIFDPVGGEASEEAFRAIKPNGKLLTVGFASGKIPAIPFNLPLLKSADIVGVFWGGFWRNYPKENRRNVKMLLSWFAQKKLRIPAPEVFAMKDAALALNAIEERRAIGKIILKT